MIAVKMPAPAVGITTRRITRHLGNPSASPASRRSSGTSLRISSVARVKIGHISTVSESAAAKPEKVPMATTTTAQMNAPATIDGVESRMSATNRMAPASRPRPYSDR
jgi:hypothetical protein